MKPPSLLSSCLCILFVLALLGCNPTVNAPKHPTPTHPDTALPQIVTSIPGSPSPQKVNTVEPTAPSPTSTTIPTPPSSPTPNVSTSPPSAKIYEVINEENFSRLQKINEVRFSIISDTFSTYPNQVQLIFVNESSPWLIFPTFQGTRVIDLESHALITDILAVGGSGSYNIITSPDNRFVAKVDFEEKKVRVWDMSSPKLAMELPYLGKPDVVAVGAFSSDNRFLGIASCRVLGKVWLVVRDCISADVHVYDLEKGEMIWELNGHQADVTGIGFSSSGNRIIMTGAGEKIRDADLLVWDFIENKRVFEAPNPANSGLLHLSLNPAKDQAITFAGFRNRTSLWNMNTWEMQKEITTNSICCVRFLPNSEAYVVVSIDGKLTLGNSEYKIETVSTDNKYVLNLFISPDGRWIYLLDIGGLLQKYGVEHSP